jgi:hypothetical protein
MHINIITSHLYKKKITYINYILHYVAKGLHSAHFKSTYLQEEDLWAPINSLQAVDE